MPEDQRPNSDQTRERSPRPARQEVRVVSPTDGFAFDFVGQGLDKGVWEPPGRWEISDDGRYENFTRAEYSRPLPLPAQPVVRQQLRDKRRAAATTLAAFRAIQFYVHLNGLEESLDPAIVAQRIIDFAVRWEVPGIDTINNRSFVDMVAAAMEGVRLARESPA